MLPDGRLAVFHPDNFSFGQPVYLSRIVAATQAVEGVEAVSALKFQRMAAPDAGSLENGVIPIGRLEIAQLANDPNFPERGRLALRRRRRQVSPAQSKTVIVPGTETCGCCEGLEASTPQGLANRMGLSAIAYRIGEYAQFKESMLAGLSSSEYPALAGLRTRDADDFTLGLIDAVACAADVLTFYQERLANELYLRTATERVSLQELAKLIGYRLRPGVAAETRLAFALETPRAPPPGLPPEPGAFVTGIPTSLTLASGLQVQSVPGPDEKPQTFETVEEITARPEWNAVRPWMSATRSPGFGATETFAARGAQRPQARRRAAVRRRRVPRPPDDQRQLGLPADRFGGDWRPPTTARMSPGSAVWARCRRTPTRRSRRRCTCCASARPCSAATRRSGEA